MAKPKRPRDINQLAKLITDLATGQTQETTDSKDQNAVTLGRKGGLVGGKARADKLTSEQRIDIAKKAAAKRWSKK